MKSVDLKKAKRRIRRRVLLARDAMTPEERGTLGVAVIERFLALPEVDRARSVMVFWAFGSEVPTASLIEELHRRSVTVSLPRTSGDRLVPVIYEPGAPTRSTSFGAEEPVGEAALDPALLDVVAVPGVAFDRRGGRIGYGGGYYDRFLREVTAFRAGLAFALQVLDEELPGGRFDLGVDAIVTEIGTIRRPT